MTPMRTIEDYDENELGQTLHEGYRSVFAVIFRIEADMLQISEALKEERQCIALFDYSALRSAVQTKDELLDAFSRCYPENLAALQVSLTLLGLNGALSSEQELPELLESLSLKAETQLKPILESLASRLRVLRDTLREQQEVNRRLILRSLSWIDSYIGEIVGGDESTVYNARGRIGNRPSLAVPSPS
jgi:hypothetical protein